MPRPQTGATHYYSQLGHPDKVCTIKGLIVCYVICLGSMDGSLDKVRGLFPCCGQYGYRAQVPQYPIDYYK